MCAIRPPREKETPSRTGRSLPVVTETTAVATPLGLSEARTIDTFRTLGGQVTLVRAVAVRSPARTTTETVASHGRDLKAWVNVRE